MNDEELDETTPVMVLQTALRTHRARLEQIESQKSIEALVRQNITELKAAIRLLGGTPDGG